MRPQPTRVASLFRLLVVIFTHELAVLGEVELVARVELAITEDTDEAAQVVDVVLSSPYHLVRGDAGVTA